MERKEDVYAVILAGGSGTRFWPKSRLKTPKQLCRIGSADETMLELTLKRLDGWIDPERRMIVTHEAQAAKTAEIVGHQVAKVLAEPDAKNTACALALAALEINQNHQGSGRPIMVSLHADHLIEGLDNFKQALDDAIEVARTGQLTLLGVKPTHPETGFGYIEKGEELSVSALSGQNAAVKVASFREKPELQLAKEYCASGRFMWNSGMFIWPTDLILAELAERLPVIVNSLEGYVKEHGSFISTTGTDNQELGAIYRKLPKIAIDNAVLEVSDKVSCLEVSFGWRDIGSWDALSEAFPTDKDGNLVYGDGVLVDCTDTTIDTDGPLVGAIGLKGYVIVSSGNGILVCPKSEAQKVKKIVETLKEREMKDYL